MPDCFPLTQAIILHGVLKGFVSEGESKAQSFDLR